MKIGIISINMHTKGLNFACPVHTYAFQQFLLANGVETTVIDYKANYYGHFEPRNPGDYYSKLCEKQLKLLSKANDDEKIAIQEKYNKFKKKADGYNSLAKEREVRYDKFQNFINSYYIKTEKSYNSDLLEVLDPGFDCYICATDVIWKYQDVEGFDRGYFLASSAMENKWKIAYSASRGVPKPYSNEQRDLFFHYLEDIDIVSVRENSLKEYIEQNSDINVKVVMDPVLLNEREVYEKVIVKPEEEHYVLFYYAEEQSPNALEAVIKYAKENDLKIVETTNLPIKEGVLSNREDVESVFKYDIGPDEWMGYIQYADCVFTNSFHASCFCIIFEKEFYVGSRHGDKITNLLQSLDLLERKLDDDNDVEFTTRHEIDYSFVKEKLKVKAQESSEFILNAIHELESKKRKPYDYTRFKKALTYEILYNSQKKNENIKWNYKEKDGKVTKLPSGSYEFKPNCLMMKNDGNSHLLKNGYKLKGYRFTGWNIRIKIDNFWFWYLQDGSLKLKEDYKQNIDCPKFVFKEKDCIPFFPVNNISLVVVEAVWKKRKYYSLYIRIKNILKKYL